MIFNANEHPESVPAWLLEDARERQIKELIEQAAEKAAAETVRRLKKAGMLKPAANAIDRTETLLRLYPTLKRAPADGAPQSVKTLLAIKKTEDALHMIENDPYFDVLTRFYFDGQSRDFIAQAHGTSVTTISRNKARLLQELAPLIFGDDVIRELFE